MHFSWSWITIIGFFILSLLCCPVSGDMLVPTNTHVFFEMDGQPYNDSVQYTVSCYGYRWSPGSGPVSSGTTSPDKEPEVVFSYSATCPEYGCTIYETYYLNYRQITSCDLEGITREGSFTQRNFSNTPMPDCTFPRQFDIVSGKNEYYRETPDYRQCLNESFIAADLCDQFLAGCDPGSDPECGNWIRDGRYVTDTNESRACRNNADLNRRACDTYLEKVDPSTLIMWYDNNTRNEYPADRICEQRFVIPSHHNLAQTGNTAVVPPLLVAQKEIQPVWCPILSYFGIAC
jgi:hypothetical protein